MDVNELLAQIQAESSGANLEVIAVNGKDAAMGIKAVSFGSFNGDAVLFLNLEVAS